MNPTKFGMVSGQLFKEYFKIFWCYVRCHETLRCSEKPVKSIRLHFLRTYFEPFTISAKSSISSVGQALITLMKPVKQPQLLFAN